MTHSATDAYPLTDEEQVLLAIWRGLRPSARAALLLVAREMNQGAARLVADAPA